MKVQSELGEVARVLPGQMDWHLVRIPVKLGRPHHHLEISSLIQNLSIPPSARSPPRPRLCAKCDQGHRTPTRPSPPAPPRPVGEPQTYILSTLQFLLNIIDPEERPHVVAGVEEVDGFAKEEAR